jgi:hypothetical protein
MSAPEFDIIFRGDIVFGQQLAEVKLRLQQLFKADAAKIDVLFSGRPVPLKRNLDEATANKYRDALLKAGAMVEVCSSDTSPANAAKSVIAPRRDAEAVTPAATGWTLAPIGADLLLPKERLVQPAPLQVDVSSLSLRPPEGNLVDGSEVHEEIIAHVVAPDLGLAAVGADLISADEKLTLPLVEVELEDWEIAEAGSDLLTEDERPVVLPAVVQVSDFGLAPAGSDLGQLRPQVKPVVPDISQLRLAE